MIFSRRSFLKTLLGGLGAFIAGAAYAVGYGPMQRLRVTRYKITPTNWPKDFKLKIAVLSDIHAVEPWMSAERITGIVEQTNALQADLVVLLGDYVAGIWKYRFGTVYSGNWATALSGLKAPLGVYAVLGNHDWWDDLTVQKNGTGIPYPRKALENAGIPVLENQSIRITHKGAGFWLAGLGDQLALPAGKPGVWRGIDDIESTLAQCTSSEPIILLAHEPEIFQKTPDRIQLTLAGHTHGGQINLFGWRPTDGTELGSEFPYGHFKRDNSHLIVSGGLGCSLYPIRIGVPPEIVMVELGT